VRHHDLGMREVLGGPGGCHIRTHRPPGDPLLQPLERRERTPRRPELAQEALHEGRGQPRWRVHEVIHGLLERSPSELAGALDARRPVVGSLESVHALDRAQRHPAHALDQPQPQHGGHGPELTYDERRDFLEGRHDAVEVVRIDAGLGVRDERDGELVHARITGERSAYRLGQLAVITLGQAVVDLPDVLLNDVKVVEEPFAGGTHIDAPARSSSEPRVHVVQDFAGVRQTGEERGVPPPEARLRHALIARDGAHAVGELVDTQKLSAQGAGEEIVPGVSRPGDETDEAAGPR
jgi:hypothetical protein